MPRTRRTSFIAGARGRAPRKTGRSIDRFRAGAQAAGLRAAALRVGAIQPGWQSGGLSDRDKGIDNLWLQPLDGSKGKQLTDFTSERVWDFHWSLDGSKLALVRGHTDADVVLI
jgi:hypothetical protein